MKKFCDLILKWKMAACMMFTGACMVFMIITFAMGHTSIPIGYLVDLMIVSFIGTFIQAIAFTTVFIKKMIYPLRLLLFVICFLPVLAVFAWKRQWFPIQYVGAWLTFILIFVGIFVVITAGFEIYYRVTGRKYDGLLGEKQRN